MSALPIGPLEPRSLMLSVGQKGRIMEAHVNALRYQLHTEVVQNKETDGTTQQLLSHASVKQRYKILNFPQLLQANSQSLVELQRLNVALTILEKYGRHLMRPPNQRSTQWATIKFMNPIFAEKVDIIQGGRTIMENLGYSVNLGDGLSYPEGAEPNPEHLAIVVADIVLARREIDDIISNQHPALQELRGYLSERCLYEIAYTCGPNPDYASPPMLAQPAPPSSRPKPDIPPRTLKPMDLPITSSLPSSSSSDCEICGEKSPDMICTICNSKQLCVSCDEKWHSHPRRQNHSRTRLGHGTPSLQTKWSPQSSSSLANQVAEDLSHGHGLWSPASMPAAPQLLKIQKSPGAVQSPMLQDPGQSEPGDSPSSDDSFHSSEDTTPTIRTNPNVLSHHSPAMVPNVVPLTGGRDSNLGASPLATESGRDSRSASGYSFPPPLPEVFRTDSWKSPITVLRRELAAIEHSRLEKKKELKALIGSSDSFLEDSRYKTLTQEKDQLTRRKLVLEKEIMELEMNNISVGLPDSSSTQKVYFPPPSPNLNVSAQSKSLLPPTRSATEPNLQQHKISPQQCGRNMTAYKTLPNQRTSGAMPTQVGKASVTLPRSNFHPQETQSLQQLGQRQFDSGKWVFAETGMDNLNPRRPSSGREFSHQWQCEHCTVINPPGINICSVCDKTSDNPKQYEEPPAEEAPAEEAPAEGATRGNDASLNTSVQSGSSIGERTRHVFEEAEEIQAQKEEARRQLALMMKEDEAKQRQPEQEVEAAENAVNTELEAGRELDDWTLLDYPHANCRVSATKPSLSVKVTDTVQGEGKTADVEKSSTKGNNLKLDVASALSQKEAADGRKVVQFLREALGHGFEPAELQMALQKCGVERSPVDWLQQSLPMVIDTVVTMVTTEGAKLEENDVGEISGAEAKTKLLENLGDVEKTVKACVQERKEKVQRVMAEGPFPRDSVLEALLRQKGDVKATLSDLQGLKLKSFAERIWVEPTESRPEALVQSNPDSEYRCNSVTYLTEFQEAVRNPDISEERRTRMVLVEGRLQSWGRAQVVLKILLEHREFSLADVIEAVRNCGDMRGSLAFLQQDCEICFMPVPMSKIRNFTLCQCKLCVDCISQYLELNIREKFVKDWSCPHCGQPDIQQDIHAAEEHFSFIDMMLPILLEREIRDLFQDKLRDWRLMQDPNFRWCAHCGNGFIYNGFAPKMECAACKGFTCFKCKRPWEAQHEGLTCEQFEQWRVDNNPDNQASGLARHLDENGIVCPSCKMRYALAKGGCMHFTCPECGHEFCCGCHLPFRRAENCNKYRSCRTQGLHCHHPRDCFFYLRDNKVEDLQSLLEKHNVEFNKDPPEGQENTATCPVMEQKDVANQRHDEACGRAVEAGHAGLCLTHYKEYLVGLINKRSIDPVTLLSCDEIQNLLKKMEMEVPSINQNEAQRHYLKRLRQFVQQKIPLQRINSSGQLVQT